MDTPKSVQEEEPRYQTVGLKELHRHIGREVKVVTLAGLTREGTLERMDRSTIYVVRIMRGGSFTMPVPRKQVKTVEVLF